MEKISKIDCQFLEDLKSALEPFVWRLTSKELYDIKEKLKDIISIIEEALGELCHA